MRVHFVMHAAFETTGCIEQWAARRGHGFAGTLAYIDEALPNPEAIDLLALMGGPQSSLELERFPYLPRRAADRRGLRRPLTAKPGKGGGRIPGAANR